MKLIRRLLWVGCLAAGSVQAQGNLDRYIMGPQPHPLCGLNDNFPNPPPLPPNAPAGARLPPGIPFQLCRSLVWGFSADGDPAHAGRDALAGLIIAIGNSGFEDKVMKPFTPPLPCKITPPVGLGPMNPQPDSRPECTKASLQTFLAGYNQRPEVRDFKRFHSILNGMNLNDSASVVKLKQARSVVQASGGAASFGELVQILE